jgi:alkylhydroperoxidase/carboxymuconolactone decarboxylase family protein YurZ
MARFEIRNSNGGDYMPEHPLKIYEDLDPKLLGLVNDTRDLALADGALPRKVKLLIALVLDAVHGASEGVQSLAREAIQAGATREEIAEALRVTQYVCGVGCVYTAGRALKEVLK